MTVFQLLIAGTDSTANTIAYGIILLARFPEVQGMWSDFFIYIFPFKYGLADILQRKTMSWNVLAFFPMFPNIY